MSHISEAQVRLPSEMKEQQNVWLWEGDIGYFDK